MKWDHKKIRKFFSIKTSLEVCLIASVILGFSLRLIRLQFNPFGIGIDITGREKILLIFIGFISALFAVLATCDASGAFKASTAIIDTIGSFKNDFKDVMEELQKFVPDSKKYLRIMVPTIFYGFLFGQKELALDCLDKLRRKLEEIELWLCRNDGTPPPFLLEIILINGGLQQRYLKKAMDKENAGLFDGYSGGVESFFKLVSQIQKTSRAQGGSCPIEVHTLNYDPYVRLFIRDYDPHRNQETTKAFILFSQTDWEKKEKFQSSGFIASREEMVKAFNMLFELFWHESKPIDVNSKFIDNLIRIK